MMHQKVLTGLAGSALALGALGAPGAHAGSDSRFEGGCSFVSMSTEAVVPGQHVGEIDIETLVYSPTPEANPVWATVTCYIAVNGVPQPGTLVAGSGAVVVTGGGVVRYDAADDDFVTICTQIDFTGPGDTTATVTGCPINGGDPGWPPPFFWDALWGIVDPVVCPVIAAAQGTYGPVDVDEQGDIFVNGELLYDCPPLNWTAG